QVLGHVGEEELVADVTEWAGQRGDSEREAAVEARLPPARHGTRRALQVVRAQRVEDAADRRRKELQRGERPAPDVGEQEGHPTAIKATPVRAANTPAACTRRTRSCRTARASRIVAIG